MNPEQPPVRANSSAFGQNADSPSRHWEFLRNMASASADEFDLERGLDRSVLVVGGCLLLAIVGSLSAGVYYALGAPRLAVIAVTIALFSGAAFAGVARRWIRPRQAGVIALTILWLGYAVTLFSSGGVDSPALSTIVIIPIAGGLFGGTRSALKWGAGTLGLLLVVGYLQYLGLLPEPFILAQADSARFRLALVCAITLLMLAFAVVQEIVHTNAHRSAIIAKEEAERASYSKTCFLYSMSHELRTPLNGVIGLSEILREQLEHAEDIELVDGIHSSGTGLLGLVDDVLDFTEISAGSAEARSSEFDPSAGLLQMCEGFSDETRKNGLEFKIRPADDVPRVKGDERRFLAAARILVDNAIKFTSEGFIHVELSWQDGWLRCAVRDSGCGIPDDQYQHIFEVFQQLDGSMTRGAGGLGMGLAHVQAIIKLLGGRLSVESTLGEGSEFCFELPAPACEFDDVELTRSRGGEGRLSLPADCHILVVDDNAVNIQVCVQLLRRLGCSSDCAINGEEAVRRCQERRYNAVLMDYQMPVMDGVAATRRIRETYSAEELPIIAITAHAREEDREACFAAGMNAHVCKPINLTELRAALQSLIVDGRTDAEVA